MNEIIQGNENKTIKNVMRNGDSYFDGGLFGWLVRYALGTIMIIISLGLLYPWAVCLLYGWKINHTVIEGRRLRFIGTGIGLFGNWIKWWILIILTLGIYGFWVGISIIKWKTRNTIFEN